MAGSQSSLAESPLGRCVLGGGLDGPATLFFLECIEFASTKQELKPAVFETERGKASEPNTSQ